ncbi:hypothetical protein [Ligilactobacillus equi]|nr:hypothetical protein [Ligilactobacillus equi]
MQPRKRKESKIISFFVVLYKMLEVLGTIGGAAGVIHWVCEMIKRLIK